MLPPRKPRMRVIYGDRNGGDIPAHRQWIRGFACIVPHCATGKRVQAHHVRKGIPDETERGGTGKKPHDKWCVPICEEHHEIAHHGHDSFERKYGIDLIARAQEFAAKSPALAKLRIKEQR